MPGAQAMVSSGRRPVAAVGSYHWGSASKFGLKPLLQPVGFIARVLAPNVRYHDHKLQVFTIS